VITPDSGRGGLTHLSIETAVMASLSLTQKSSRCSKPEVYEIFRNADKLLA